MKTLENDLRRVMIAGAGLGASLLFFSLYLRDVEKDSLVSSSGQPIGYIEQFDLDVSRRPKSRLLWIPVLSRAHVFEKDTIRTGPNSSVVINLGSKGRVELRPDSLAVLETQGDSFRINLASGDLFLKGDLVAKIGDTEIKSSGSHSGSSFAVSRDSISGQYRVESQIGKLELTKAGQKSDLNEGSQFIESQDGASVTIKIPIARLTPLDGSQIQVKSLQQPIDFAVGWVQNATPSQFKDIKDLQIEFSKTRLFNKVIQTVTVPIDQILKSQSQQVTLGGEGSYFWRVKDATTQALLSSTGRFVVKAPSPWTWKQTQDNPTFIAELGDQGLSLDLDWVGPKEARMHELKFKIKDKLVAQTQSGAAQRIRYQKENAPWVEALKKLGSAELADLRIELLAQDIRQKSLVQSPLVATLMFDDARLLPPLINLTDELQKDPRSIKLSWTTVGDASKSELHVGDKTHQIKERSIVLETQEVLQALEQGKLKVRAYTDDGRVGAWQEWVLSKIKLQDAVSLNAPVTLLTPGPQKGLLLNTNQGVEFRWSPLGSQRLSPVKYRLTVKASNKVVASSEPKDARSTIEGLKIGTYTWSVQAIWPGNISGPPSEERSFEILRKTLRAPSIRLPATVK